MPPYESTVTARLWERGAVMLGKLNMDEFAMGSSTEHSVYGPAVSPWRRAGDPTPLTPGGSSGGSAAAVAADLCLGATGTDTGGSIRQPAAFTGIVGVKPTYGRCSRWGIVAFASSLDQAGPMAEDRERRGDPADRAWPGTTPRTRPPPTCPCPTSQPALTRRPARQAHRHARRIPRRRHARGDRGALGARAPRCCATPAPRSSRSACRTRSYALPAYYVIAPAEASSNLARYDGVRYGRRARTGANEGVTAMYERTRAEGFGREVQRRVMIGTYVLSAGYYDAYYLRAQKVRTLIKRDFETVFADGSRRDPDARRRRRPPSGSASSPTPTRCGCISTTSSPSR